MTFLAPCCDVVKGQETSRDLASKFGGPVPGAKEFLQMLMDDTIPFIVITNEHTLT